jgi:hypothetical protein
MKALTEAGSLGGSKLNLKGTGWKTDGTFRSTDGDEVASGTDCTVILGTRLMPSKPFASVLASSVRLGLACYGETTHAVVSGARTTLDMSPAGVPASSTRSTADEVPPPAWPRLPRLLLLWRGKRRDKPGCCSSAIGGKTSSSSPPPGELTVVVVAVALRGKEYHVVAAVEGHELETPETEQCLGLKRLLETTHLELNGKLFVNTQQAPTWRANCRCFAPGGSLDRRVKLSLRVPAQMGWREMEHKGENAARVILRQGDALVVGVTSVRERESEPVHQLVLPRDPPA